MSPGFAPDGMPPGCAVIAPADVGAPGLAGKAAGEVGNALGDTAFSFRMRMCGLEPMLLAPLGIADGIFMVIFP